MKYENGRGHHHSRLSLVGKILCPCDVDLCPGPVIADANYGIKKFGIRPIAGLSGITTHLQYLF